MAQRNPELIELTKLVFEGQTKKELSDEDSRQAVENISGFFRVLQDWAEAEDMKGCDEDSYHPDQSKRRVE